VLTTPPPFIPGDCAGARACGVFVSLRVGREVDGAGVTLMVPPTRRARGRMRTSTLGATSNKKPGAPKHPAVSLARRATTAL
jgi:hypothetical protein